MIFFYADVKFFYRRLIFFGLGVFCLCPINFGVEDWGRDIYGTVRERDFWEVCKISIIGPKAVWVEYLGLK